MDKVFSVGIVIGAAFGKGYHNVFNTNEQKLKILGDTYKNTNAKLTAANSLGIYKKKLDEIKAKHAAVGGSSQRLTVGMRKLEDRYRRAKREAKRYGITVSNAVREQKKLEASSIRLSRRLKDVDLRKRNRALLSQLNARSSPLIGAAYAGRRLFGSALGLERQEVRLKTVINAEDTESAVRKARQHATDFARRSLAGEEEILDIQYSLNSAGLSAETSLFASEIVSKVATVTNGISGQVATIIGDIYNNIGGKLLGSTKDKIGQIGDVLTKTQFQYSINNFGQLGESFKEGMVGSLAANVSFEQTAAILGQLNSAGLKGSMAGTSYNAMLRQMTKASDQLGFSIERTANGELDVIATLERLQAVMADFDDPDELADALQKAFGDEGEKATVLLLQDLVRLRDGYAGVKEGSADIVDQSYQDFLQSTDGQVKMLGGNLKIIGTTLVGTLLPALNSVVSVLGIVAKAIGSFMQEFPTIGLIISSVAVGFFTFMAGAFVLRDALTLASDGMLILRAATSGLGKIIPGVITGTRLLGLATINLSRRTLAFAATSLVGMSHGLIGLVRGAIPAAIVGLRALTIAMMTNPIGLIVGGIALAAGLIIANWNKVKDFFTTIWDSIKPVWEIFGTWISGYFDIILAPFRWVWDKISMVGGAIGKATSEVFGSDEVPATIRSDADLPWSESASGNQRSSTMTTSTQTVQIIVNAAPGQDVQSIAERVVRILDRRQLGLAHDGAY